jgi:hypothetical protein
MTQACNQSQIRNQIWYLRNLLSCPHAVYLADHRALSSLNPLALLAHVVPREPNTLVADIVDVTTGLPLRAETASVGWDSVRRKLARDGPLHYGGSPSLTKSITTKWVQFRQYNCIGRGLTHAVCPMNGSTVRATAATCGPPSD